MDNSGEYDGTIRFIQARWPLFLFGYGGGAILVIAAVIFGILRGWLALLPLALAFSIIIAYLAGTAIYSAHRLYDSQNIRDKIFDLGNFRPDDSFVCLDVGVRWLPASMARRLTTGKIIVIDIYNPLLTPDGNLARTHRRALHPSSDPRLSWRDGDISLLPLPDGTVPAVVLSEVASEFWQLGDREKLISEIYRILKPGGHLILAERVRTPSNLLLMGLNGFEVETADYWRNLITKIGFRIKREESLEDLMHFIRADKPLPQEGQQLIFDF